MFFLLVKGNDHSYAHHHHVYHAPITLTPKSAQPGSGSVTKSETQICQSSAPSDTEADTIDVTDEIEDDDDFIFSRKYVDISNYFLTFFYNQLSGNLNLYQKDRLPFCKHFSYASSSKYIVYRVIRV